MPQLRFRDLGLQHYQPVFEKMQAFTAERNNQSDDEIWFLQHHPVYTLGLKGDRQHLLNPHDIPVVQTDRGGQVTYHGPGQITAYLMLDIQRYGLGVQSFVSIIEQAIIRTLAELGIAGQLKENAPGVYVQGKKIASLGLKIKKNFSYHGLALNVEMDKTPFTWINPCGFHGLEMCQVADFVPCNNIDKIMNLLKNELYTTLHDRLISFAKGGHST